jgi:hypothetical protein
MNIHTLAALVQRRRGEFPDQAENWVWYLMSLRDHAALDGRLPASVEALVYEVFDVLLQPPAAPHAHAAPPATKTIDS